MPTHTTHVGPLGPLISVGVNVGRLYAARGYGGRPASHTALIDTGANTTAISPTVKNALKPQVIGERPLVQTGGISTLLEVVDIRLQLGGLFVTPSFWFDIVAVVSQPATPGVDLLIGYDILAQIHFAWDGPNASCTITY